MKAPISVASAAALLAACATMSDPGPSAGARLDATRGNNVTGSVSFTPKGSKMLVKAEVRGLAPGLHGFHIHEKGDCGSGDGMSAGGHFNPHKKPHGGASGAERHAGGLGNLNADASGVARLEIEVEGLTLGSGEGNIGGRGMIVHAAPDDFKTQPTGNSGARVACGVIVMTQSGGTSRY
ncbi:MAG: superoxide dismutase family protein [Betaproteobacteria bacterium]|nr:superoxide dismutase family protein [Betaproteobacteria bacterium]